MFAYWRRRPMRLVLARLLNDHVAETVAARPDRFVGLGTIPLQDTDLAIAELERCVRQLGLAGIQIGTHVGDRDLDDPAIYPSSAAAERWVRRCSSTPGTCSAPERMTRYWLPWLVGMPTECRWPSPRSSSVACWIGCPRCACCSPMAAARFPGSLGRIEAAASRPGRTSRRPRRDTEPREAVRPDLGGLADP